MTSALFSTFECNMQCDQYKLSKDRALEMVYKKIDGVKRDGSLIDFTTILTSLETKVDALLSVNEKIISQTSQDETEEEIVQTELYMIDIDLKLNTLRAHRDKIDTSSSRGAEIQTTEQQASSEQSTSIPDVRNSDGEIPLQTVSTISSASSQFQRLPKLTLPTFGGGILQWQTFWDSFESTVHFNPNLTDIQKFNYSKVQLEGDAARTLGGFALTNANYLRALALLKERFGKSHNITSAYIILGKTNLDMEGLQTVMTEIEAVMNDRPLTNVSSNQHDPEPLTPAHLLCGRRIKALPYSEYGTESKLNPFLNKAALNKRLKLQAEVIELFRRRWKFEYLTNLREYHKTTGGTNQSIQTGEVVQIHDDTPRVHWKLGMVTELMTGKDGVTRWVKLKTSNGFTTRPITKLYPLEVIDTNDN